MSAPSLHVRPGLHHCLVRDRTIFLDVPANRYFALSPNLDSAFRAVTGVGTREPDQSAIDRLRTLGILISRTACPIGDEPSADPVVANRSAAATTASILLCTEFLLRYQCAVAELRITSFESVLARRSAALTRWRVSRKAECPIGTVVAAARCIDGLVSSYRRCLPRSLAIFGMIGVRGHLPRIIIGVGHTAFAGHCWVQVGETVVGDEIDRVRLCTPILAI